MKVLSGFKRIEHDFRNRLSRHPIIYAVFGAVGMVLFWRGVWHTTDFIAGVLLPGFNPAGVNIVEIIDGLISLSLGFLLLLSTGLFVFEFIGAEVIATDLKGEEKLTKKTEVEIETEKGTLNKIHNEMHGVSKRLAKLEKKAGIAEDKK